MWHSTAVITKNRLIIKSHPKEICVQKPVTTRAGHIRMAKKNKITTVGGALALTALSIGGPLPAVAADAQSTIKRLESVDVTATGASAIDSASSGDISHDQLQTRPLLRPGAVLEAVPGLGGARRAGGGGAGRGF